MNGLFNIMIKRTNSITPGKILGRVLLQNNSIIYENFCNTWALHVSNEEKSIFVIQ